MKRLSDENRLDFENFYKEYKIINNYSDFDSNIYDKKFENNIEEEYEI